MNIRTRIYLFNAWLNTALDAATETFTFALLAALAALGRLKDNLAKCIRKN